MGVELTPNGSYGDPFPNMPRLVSMVVFGLMNTYIKLRGGTILTLITTGAKSGQERRVSLSCFRDGDNAWLIVASAGGAIKHPAWYVNMTRNPDKIWIEMDGRKQQVQAESLKGDVYKKTWDEIVAKAANYAAYQQKTDRQIPIVRLTPIK